MENNCQMSFNRDMEMRARCQLYQRHQQSLRKIMVCYRSRERELNARV